MYRTRTTNMSPDTGIRYGTIYLNELDPDTSAHLFGIGKNVSYEEAMDEMRMEVAIEAAGLGLDESDREHWEDRELERRADHIQIDEPIIEGECEFVSYHISWLGGAPLLWVFYSPHVGRFDLCSPCVPNACNLTSPNDLGYEGYSVPPDWLRKGN